METDTFTSLSELEARLKAVKERITQIDLEHGVRSIDGEDREEWNTLNTEHDDLVKLIDEINVRRARVAELAEDEERNVEVGVAPAPKRFSPPALTRDWTRDVGEIRMASRSQDEFRQKLESAALHYTEQDDFPNPNVNREDAQAHIERLLKTVSGPPEGDDPGLGREKLARRILQCGSPEYRKAFSKWLAYRDTIALSPEEQRALSVGTTTAGGFALVPQLDPTLVPTSNSVVNPWRALARIETIAGTNEFKLLTSGAITSAYSAEATESSDNSPTLAQPDLIVEKAQAFIPFSYEIGQDWDGMAGELAGLLGESKDDLEATKFATGAGHGSQEPKGLLTGATNTVGTTTTAAFVVADTYKVFEALAPRFRPRAQWCANLFIIDKVRQFDTSGGSGVWIGNPGLQADTTAQANGTTDGSLRFPLLGRIIHEATAMASALTTTSKIMVVGDFRYFIIVDRIGMNIELVPTLFGTAHRPTGQRGFYATWRNTSDVVSAAGFQVLVT